MVARYISALLVFVTLFSTSGSHFAAQENDTHIRVVVNLVQLNVAVTDNKGNYITGLKPQDFAITEDGIHETMATFAEGNESERRLVDPSELAKSRREKLRFRKRFGLDGPRVFVRLAVPWFTSRRSQRIHLVRYQQLYVPRFRFCAGCNRGFRKIP